MVRDRPMVTMDGTLIGSLADRSVSAPMTLSDIERLDATTRGSNSSGESL